MMVTKRKRYGADPLFISNAEANEAISEDHDANETRLGQNPKDTEGYVLRSRNKQPIGHTSKGGPASRKALTGLTCEINGLIGLTPEDRARASMEKHDTRPAQEVFSERAPQVLDLHSYLLNQRPKAVSPTHTMIDVTGCESRSSVSDVQVQTVCPNPLEEIPEDEIIRNRLSADEIRQLPSGKFSKYTPGNPSQVIYIKNLSKDVAEEDLVALFARYQKSQKQPLLFRLMKRGRMKGQAFITFSDTETSSKALQLLNGYMLKGKPMVIEFGHHSSSSSVRLSESEVVDKI